jgi:hypothetical protein
MVEVGDQLFLGSVLGGNNRCQIPARKLDAQFGCRLVLRTAGETMPVTMRKQVLLS